MCIKCVLKGIAEGVIEEATGCKFEEKFHGLASPASMNEVKRALSQARTLEKQRDKEIEAINARYEQQLEEVEKSRLLAWRAALESVGVKLEEGADYSIDTRTGAITEKVLTAPGGERH